MHFHLGSMTKQSLLSKLCITSRKVCLEEPFVKAQEEPFVKAEEKGLGASSESFLSKLSPPAFCQSWWGRPSWDLSLSCQDGLHCFRESWVGSPSAPFMPFLGGLDGWASQSTSTSSSMILPQWRCSNQAHFPSTPALARVKWRASQGTGSCQAKDLTSCSLLHPQ